MDSFHAFTGCDTVSFFCGQGKKTTFEILKTYPDAVRGFELLNEKKLTEAMAILDKFVIAMYDK